MAHRMIKKTVITMFSFLIIAGFSTTAFTATANKEIVTGDIKASKKITVMAKAPTDKAFESLDTDDDGKISLQEAVKNSALALKFNDTDVNHDGVITVDEYALYTSTSKETTEVN
jgi:Ca2+-binding EF-hand superfamily protein